MEILCSKAKRIFARIFELSIQFIISGRNERERKRTKKGERGRRRRREKPKKRLGEDTGERNPDWVGPRVLTSVPFRGRRDSTVSF